ncbi:MAG: Phosphoserine phosphatase RsbU [Chlamydiae bacterium]|nr:Phosphoserine phosphatase RsbU [Chlamydiota bacterium]
MAFKRLIPSLATRVLWITLAFLILPLSLYSFFMYQEDSEDHKETAFLTMQILLQSRIEDVEVKIKNALDVLYTLGSNPNLLDNSDVLKDVSSNLEADDDIMLLELKNNQYICTYSKNPTLIGKDFSSLKVVRGAKQYGQTAGLERIDENTNQFVVASNFNTFILLFTSDTTSLIESLEIVDVQYPLELSILSKNYFIVASTDSSLIGTKVDQKYSKPKGSIAKIFTLNAQDGIHFALMKKITTTSMSLMIDTPKKALDLALWETYAFKLLLFLILIFVFGGLLVFFLTKRMARPFYQLSDVMTRVADGDLDQRFCPDKMGFEINQLGLNLNTMLDRLIHHMKTAQKEKIKREEVEVELKVASEIQKTLLPHSLPQLKSLELSAKYIPAKEVCGDFYDLFQIKNKLLIVVADGSGKGVSACLISHTLRSLLRSQAYEHSNLDEILKNANQLFYEDIHETSMFVTAWVGLLDLKTFKFEYASCGHPLVFLKTQNKLSTLETKGIALGVDPSIHIEIKKHQLEKDDLLFLFTDGLIEQQNPKGQLFGMQRAKKLLDKQLSSQELIKHSLKTFNHFKSSASQDDDITLLAIRHI